MNNNPICTKCDYYTLGFRAVLDAAKARHQCVGIENASKQNSTHAETPLTEFVETLPASASTSTTSHANDEPPAKKLKFAVNEEIYFFDKTKGANVKAIILETINEKV